MNNYEKVLLERDRRDRWRAYQANKKVEESFDWFVKDTLDEFYDYDPRND